MNMTMLQVSRIKNTTLSLGNASVTASVERNSYTNRQLSTTASLLTTTGPKMAVVFPLLVLLTFTPKLDATPRDLKFTLLRSYNDIKFNEHLLFERVVGSVMECAHECSRVDNCLHFTFIPGGEQTASLCRGHSNVITSSMTTASGAGTHSFIQDWIKRTCEDDTDCKTKLPEDYMSSLGPLASPVCFQHRCLCYPGYFLSLSRTLCVQDCSRSDLQDDYTKYPRSGISYHNDYTHTGTVEDCKGFCSSKSDCENFEIQLSSDETELRICHLATVSGYSVGFELHSSWDHYQRDCA